MNRKRNEDGVAEGLIVTIAGLVVVGLVLLLLIGGWSVIKAVHRHQQVADAKNYVKTSQIRARNQTKLNEIRISQQAQLVKVAQQKAQIRFENSKGVREAQDEIAKTLTPLYVQFEMVQALQQIASSGKNNTVVYVPSGANGIPLVSGLAGQPAVGSPDGK